MTYIFICFSITTTSPSPIFFSKNKKTSQVTYVTMVPQVGNETLRPLRVAMWNAVSVTRV